MKKVHSLRVCHSITDLKYNTRYTFSISELDDIGTDFMTYIEDSHIIDFSLGYPSENNYEKIYSFILRLDKNGNKCKVIVNSEITNRKLFNDIFLNNNFKNVKLIVYSDNCFYSLKDYLNEEKMLNKLVLPIQKQNFSPLEKYIAIYNIVKNFKVYKQSKNYQKSTCLKHILHNEYIVCLGFSKLLIVLCEKVGIRVNEIGVELKDSCATDEAIMGHSRCVVSIDDNKYHVHGLYMADPTWDNNLEENRFNHALMTFDQMQVASDMFYYSLTDPILDIHNFEEFKQQINYLFKESIKYYTFNNYAERLEAAYVEVLESVLNVISCDPKIEYFYDIYNKCNVEDDYIKLLTELGNYLLTRINKRVNDNKVIYAVLYTDKMLGKENDVESMIINHYLLDFMKFPYRVDKKREHRLIKKKVLSVPEYRSINK